MKLRLMVIEDYPDVYDLWLNTSGMGLNNIDDSRQGIAKYLKRNPSSCFVAEEDGRIIGVILSGHDGRRGFIHHTTVREGFRRCGIGRALVSKALEALEAEGINKVALVVFRHNESGNEFWAKAGFDIRGDLIYRNKSIHELIRIDT